MNFEVWAPTPRLVRLDLDGTVVSMTRDHNGWWRTEIDADDNARYGFLLDEDHSALPDPRSSRQPDGVHARSQVHRLDPTQWTDHSWTGRPLPGAVIYELHIGTFTPAGTFDAAIERLDHLVDLGVTFVEVMPVNAVNGTHNWGYDGVLWYAVHEPYGGPDGLQRFVNACHTRGLAVALDVVYNHLGPSGNYLPRFGPYLTDGRNTWGETINIGGPDSGPVRRYILDSALRWFREFHIDALRLDAVHALVDHTGMHLLEQLAVETQSLAAHLGRPLSLIAESDLNDPRLITPRASGGYGLTGQWNDDLHHAVHTAVSGERQGYYADFGSMACLAKTMTRGFFHAGTYSSFRRRVHGRPIDVRIVPGSSLVVYPTTHDQVGNRASGDRPSAYLSPGQLALKAALILFSPYTPMIFMGEEWGAGTPFQFFTSHPEPELGRATAEGRRREFAEHGWAGEVPDPQDPQTFVRSKLDWSELGTEPHRRVLDCYRSLLALRRARPEITDPRMDLPSVQFHESGRWIALRRGPLLLIANLGDTPAAVSAAGVPLLWWDPPVIGASEAMADESAAAPRLVTVPAHSFVILEDENHRASA